MTKWNDILLPWMRSRRRLMLIVAWLIWSLSLSAPAINFPNIVFLSDDMIRVRSLVLYGIVELSPALGPGAEILPYFGMMFFVVSPLTMLARARGRILSRIGWLMTAGLLLPWGMPILRFCTPHIFLGGYPLMWGFYLFASAQTLAFVACAIGPSKPQKASRQRGFAVLPPVRPPVAKSL
jgi:hypothetical protein